MELYPYWIMDTGQDFYIWTKVDIPANSSKTIYITKKEGNSPNPEQVFIRVIDGLVGCWHFDEGQGNIAYDSSGNNLHGTIHGTVKWVDGYYGKALEFDGSSTYVEIPAFELGGPITVCSRAYIYEHRDWQKLIDFGYEEIVNFSELHIYGVTLALLQAEPKFYVHNDLSIYVASSNEILNLNTWYFFTGIVDDAKIKLLVDTQLKAKINGPKGGLKTVTMEHNFIGKELAKGIIDEVMIFNKALTEEEIQDIYKYGGQGSYSGHLLVGYRRLSNDLQFGQITIKEF